MRLSTAAAFRRDRTANIGAALALLSVPMVGAVGLAVDYQQVASARQFLQSQVDAAALGGAGAGRDGDSTRWLERAENATRAHFDQNNGLSTLAVTGRWIDDDNFAAEAQATVGLFFVQILPGIPDAVDVRVQAVAALALPVLVYEEPQVAQLDPRAGDYNRLSAYCYDPAAANAGDDGRSQSTVIADNGGTSFDFTMPQCEAGEALSYRLDNVRGARTQPRLWDDPLRERYAYHTDTEVSDGVERYDLDGWDIMETVLCPTLDDCRPESEGGIIPEGTNRVPQRADEPCQPGQFMYYGWEDRPPGRGWTDRDYDDIRLIIGCPVVEFEGDKRVRLVD